MHGEKTPKKGAKFFHLNEEGSVHKKEGRPSGFCSGMGGGPV